jgi:CIC family chloride channel protein
MKAPLAGAVFAAELLVLRGMTTNAVPPAVLCSAVAFGVSTALGGGAPVFAEGASVDRFAAAPDRPVTYGVMILVGVTAGAAGKAYAVLLHSTGEWFSRRRAAPAVKLVVAGLVVGTAGLFVPGVAGTGFTLVDRTAVSSHLVAESLVVVLLTPLVKVACTSLTLGSGAPAGAFGPGLVVGASVGAACWRLSAPLGVAPDSPEIFVLAGAVAGIGSISHAPVAAVVLAAEIAGGLECVPAVVLAVVAAVVVVGDTTLFRGQLDGPGVASPRERPPRRRGRG